MIYKYLHNHQLNGEQVMGKAVSVNVCDFYFLLKTYFLVLMGKISLRQELKLGSSNLFS